MFEIVNNRTVNRYGFAVIAVAVATGATSLIPPIGAGRPFLIFLFGAVAASSWRGGSGPGWLAVLLSTLVIDFFYIPPIYVITGNVEDLPWLLAFVICAVVGNMLGARYRRLEREIAELRARLRAVDLGDELQRRRPVAHLRDTGT